VSAHCSDGGRRRSRQRDHAAPANHTRHSGQTVRAFLKHRVSGLYDEVRHTNHAICRSESAQWHRVGIRSLCFSCMKSTMPPRPDAACTASSKTTAATSSREARRYWQSVLAGTCISFPPTVCGSIIFHADSSGLVNQWIQRINRFISHTTKAVSASSSTASADSISVRLYRLCARIS
jgi:hypothetical protein